MFQTAQGLDQFVWTNKERAEMQAFLFHYKGEEGIDASILEAGEGDRLAGGVGVLPEGTGLREGRDGA